MKSFLRTLLIAASAAGSANALAFEGTCASVEECGEPENPPFYYDWTYKPSSMYWITRISYLQSTIVPMTYTYEVYNQYKKDNAQKLPSAKELYDAWKDPKEARLKSFLKVALAHEFLWGFAFFFNILALTGIFPVVAKFWLLHIWSNLEWVVNIYGIIMLFDGDVGGGWIFMYGFFQLIWWALTAFLGMGAVTFLDRDYPYLDTTLIPSIFYLLGLSEHVEQYPFEDVEWPEDEEKDVGVDKDDVKNTDKGSKSKKDDTEEISGDSGKSIDDTETGSF